ncbi:efflux RND transporter periplasmic adaptor subunit [Dyadobacter sp. 50-39]|uniref:efflux RND transporter periplasmic adaptor subunit n=1 Tax=Dyadobacter sp. 50-39 TaxID=1895756 RepID=UPI0025B9F641|nr:efflux RND transporter periplasmic adaptor subunit [Dyadobacter sp. 50-39]
MAALFFSCSSIEQSGEDDLGFGSGDQVEDTTVVKIGSVLIGGFESEIICNGRLSANKQAVLRFRISEQIQEIRIVGGEHVDKGQVLAVLRGDELENQSRRSRLVLEKATVDLDDRLIDYGYRIADTLRVPRSILRMAKIKSGYLTAQFDYDEVQQNLGKTKVTAPFAGTVANLSKSAHNDAQVNDELCTLLDESEMRVEFTLLEGELDKFSPGTVIEVVAANGVVVEGSVTHINPVVEKSGLVRGYGIIKNVRGRLLSGMNVEVIVKRQMKDKMYVPKAAVVRRDNRSVVFTFDSGRAKWNYVETGNENRGYICIESGLNGDQKVIVSNNLTLAHDSFVKIDSRPIEQL